MDVGKMRIGGRLTLVTLAIMVGLVLVAGLSLMRLDRVMRADVGTQTQHIVETAHSVVASIEARQRAGEMTQAQAQATALAALKVMRYGNNDYLFVIDTQPRMVMHPIKPELDGKDLTADVDADGVHPFQEMAKVVRGQGEGSVAYRWPRPGASEAQPKISFVKGFAPWGWIIGSGVYVDDIHQAVWREARTMIGIVLAIVIVAGGLALLLGRSISGPITALTARMRALAAGDTDAAIPARDRTDEIGEMARALDVFRSTAVEKAVADVARATFEHEQKRVVDTVSTHLSDLSGGDLTGTITQDFPPAYAALKANYNDAVTRLRDLIGSVSDSTAAIRTGSGEIAQASEDLARRTEANAASLQETASSVQQMDSRLRAAATAATRTVERADQAIATVGDGRAVADEAVQAMGRVSDSAKGIDSVIEGLDKIAFQTRVLAMNAAVEAGRAGDAGRGFAVVADLVSALAMRAEEEAKRARDQLTVTQTDIVTAVEAVTKVDGALADISGDVAQVHELLATMAIDNQAQASAITEITIAIGTMDMSTQQNAAMVEETSAAARNLAGEVGSLADQAARFRVKQGGGRADYATAAAYAAPARPSRGRAFVNDAAMQDF
jgi:methyl-accepting chemotaxis protein